MLNKTLLKTPQNFEEKKPNHKKIRGGYARAVFVTCIVCRTKRMTDAGKYIKNIFFTKKKMLVSDFFNISATFFPRSASASRVPGKIVHCHDITVNLRRQR